VLLAIQIYLIKISAIKVACSAKPKPIVMILSISLFKMALMNSNTRAVQTIRMMSTPGILSVRPFITATQVGSVAQCKTSTATQPIASALIWLNFSAKNVFIPVTNLSKRSKNCSILNIPIKDMVPDLSNLWLTPSWVNIICMIVHGIF